jgi:transposase
MAFVQSQAISRPTRLSKNLQGDALSRLAYSQRPESPGRRDLLNVPLSLPSAPGMFSAPGEAMARYKHYDYAQTVMVPVSLEKQLTPGTLEFAIHILVQHYVATSLFQSRYKNDDTGFPAYDPKVLLQIVLFAYAGGILSSRKIERACRENITFMALACGMLPDHSTIAAFVSSMKEEIVSLFRDILLVCEEQGLLGGTHFALDGLKLPSNAAKEWSGTFADLRQKQAKLEEKIKKLLEEHTRAAQAGETSSTAEQPSERDKVHEQRQRLEKQAARIAKFLAENEPKRGKRGKELQSHVTDNDSAKMQTSHGVLQGYNGQALVDAKHQIILHAAAFGNGQDYGHVAPMLEGAKAHGKAIGLPPQYFEGKIRSADSNYHSEANLQVCVQEQLDAYIPDTHFRQRDLRFATQARHKPHPQEKFTLVDFTYDHEHDCYVCPNDKCLKLEARRHQIGHNLYRRYEANEADCSACPLRKKCLQNPKTRRKHLAVFIEPASETLSQQMITKIDTPEARAIYGQRLAIVEPVFGNIRSQKRFDRFTLRGKIKVNIQWMLYCMVHNIEKIVHYGMAA